MAKIVSIKSLQPRPFGVAGYRKEILKALRAEGTQIKKLMLKTVRTWETKPTFVKKVNVRGIIARVEISTKDERWGYLNYGTRIRWALMSNPFTPKTRVGVIGSYPGRGKAILRGRSAMRQRGVSARPGIEAREWTQKIIERRQKAFEYNMSKAIKRASKGAF